MVLLHKMVKRVEMVLLNKMVQPLVQPSKLASETTENDSTWKVIQVGKIIPLYGSIQLKSFNQWKGIPGQNDPIA